MLANEEESVIPKNITVITNPAGTAGRKLPLLAIFNDIFRPKGINWQVSVTQDTGDAKRLAQEAVQGGADVVAACGGDGTVMEVAEGLMGSDVPLAIFPAGTANVMSLELGIAGDLELAVSLVAEGNNVVRSVDMGKINDRCFLLRAAIGAEAEMTLQTPREAKSRWGNLAYMINGLNSFTNPVVSDYTLWLDGLTVQVDGISCMIANSGNVGMAGVSITPGVQISDGMLDVIVIRSGDLPSLLAVATAMILNSDQKPEPLLHWQAREVRVLTDPAQPVIADGEEAGKTPVVAQVLPHAVRIICPVTNT